MTADHPTAARAQRPAPLILADRYELGEVIGEGGMGTVHKARDRRIDRDVAVKLLKPGVPADSPAATRFLVEAQITGQLQHPGIPPVYELGTLPDGQPFLAMKLVKGRTLRELLAERTSPATDLGRFVAIFEQVCHGAGYAHAHRLIHRDLKPANVMVGAHGEVQVMDWGLAKRLGEPAGDGRPTADPNATIGQVTEVGNPGPEGLATRTGSVLGTPAYMPPEQAAGDVRTLDVRSDVFGLGAVLCEVLTGRPPYAGEGFQAVRLQAIRGETGEALARLEACAAEPELVVLCRRCLAFKQEDRPADGRAVAAAVADIRQAAEARARQAEIDRERAVVRAAEQTKRRRLTLVAAGAVAAVLALGVIGTAIGLVRAKAAAAQERAAKDEALKRLTQIEKGVELFAEMLTGIDPRAQEKGGEPLYAQLRKKAEQAAAELNGETVGDPLAVARLQTILGNTLRELGSYQVAVTVEENALATREQKLGADHPDTLTTRNSLALAYWEAGRLPEAIRLFGQVRDARVKALGADHPDTLGTLDSLARAYRAACRLPEAIRLLEQAHDAQAKALGADHPDSLGTLNNLALAYDSAGRLPEAIRLFEQVRDALERTLGADHPLTLITLSNLAAAYRDAGRLPEALRLHEQAARSVARRHFQHEYAGRIIPGTVAAYEAAGQFDKAEDWQRQWLAHVKEKAGPQSAAYAGEQAVLGTILLERKNWALAEAVLRESLTVSEANQPDAWTTFATMSLLGEALLGQNKPAAAESLLVQGYEGLKARGRTMPKEAKPRITAAIDRLVRVSEALGRPDDAAKWRKELATAGK